MKVVKKINNMLEIPKEIYTNDPKVTIIGFKEIMVENYNKILEYESYYIKINTYIGKLNINGSNLKIEKMKENSLKISGEIVYIEIEK